MRNLLQKTEQGPYLQGEQGTMTQIQGLWDFPNVYIESYSTTYVVLLAKDAHTRPSWFLLLLFRFLGILARTLTKRVKSSLPGEAALLFMSISCHRWWIVSGGSLLLNVIFIWLSAARQNETVPGTVALTISESGTDAKAILRE